MVAEETFPIIVSATILKKKLLWANLSWLSHKYKEVFIWFFGVKGSSRFYGGYLTFFMMLMFW